MDRLLLAVEHIDLAQRHLRRLDKGLANRCAVIAPVRGISVHRVLFPIVH